MVPEVRGPGLAEWHHHSWGPLPGIGDSHMEAGAWGRGRTF